MREAATKLDPALAERVDALGSAFAATPLQDLQVDYTALFLNPTGAAAMPYESFWVGGKDPMQAQDLHARGQALLRPGGVRDR